MAHYKVTMNNEGGERVNYSVEAGDVADARREAWRAYRELPYRDHAEPPSWTQPISIKEGQMKSSDDDRKNMHESRLECIREFVERHIDRPLLPNELTSLKRLNEQDLHLLSAAIDNVA